jgi:hypothetical protein
MAGLVPVGLQPTDLIRGHLRLCLARSARRRCVDARIKSGHDELVGILHHLNDPEHWAIAPSFLRGLRLVAI